MADRLLKSISSRGLKNAVKGSEYRKEALISYGVLVVGYILLQLGAAVGFIGHNLQGQFVPICVYVSLAISLNLVVGISGELSLGHAGFMAVGAFTGVVVTRVLEQSIEFGPARLMIALLVAAFAAAIAGFIIGIPILGLRGDYLAIVTLAFGEIVRTIFKNLETFGGALGLSTKKYGSELFIIALIMVLIMLFVIQNLIRSKHGRAITAIRDNEIAAKAMGINVTFYKLLVFVISAFFAGIAGVIYGHYATPVLYSFFSYNYSIEILVMVVLGGMGSITGSIIAATLITYINFILTTNLSGDLAALKFLIYALILIAMIIFNNAPALNPFKEKLAEKKDKIVHTLLGKFVKKDPAKVDDDSAAWHRIPSKIKMDALLSLDLTDKQNYKDGGDKK